MRNYRKNYFSKNYGMVKTGAKQVYIFFNNDAEGYAPKNALEIAEMLL